MFANLMKYLAFAPTLVLSACAISSASNANSASPAPFSGEALAKACEGRDGWSDPAPPARLHGSTYYVGTCGITALLIDSGDRLILIDGATEEAAPFILANIRALGFDPKDIAFMLASHEHYDHVAGLGAIQREIGVKVKALPQAQSSLKAGTSHPSDPQADILDLYPPLSMASSLADRQIISLGQLEITPYSTPVHTIGSTSFRWNSCEGDQCLTIAYMDSLSTPPANYRFMDHPDQVSRVREGFEKAATIQCDLLITPHPSASDLFPRLSGTFPMSDAESCEKYSEKSRQIFEQRLAKEKE